MELGGGKRRQFETLLEIYEVLKCFIPRGWLASCHRAPAACLRRPEIAGRGRSAARGWVISARRQARHFPAMDQRWVPQQPSNQVGLEKASGPEMQAIRWRAWELKQTPILWVASSG
jgi:hypothetical protein